MSDAKQLTPEQLDAIRTGETPWGAVELLCGHIGWQAGRIAELERKLRLALAEYEVLHGAKEVVIIPALAATTPEPAQHPDTGYIVTDSGRVEVDTTRLVYGDAARKEKP